MWAALLDHFERGGEMRYSTRSDLKSLTVIVFWLFLSVASLALSVWVVVWVLKAMDVIH